MRAGIEARNNTYHNMVETFSWKRKRVLTTLMQMREATNRQIADRMGVPINQVTGRVSELQEFFMVYKTGIKANEDTGKSSTVWAPLDDEQKRQELIIRSLETEQQKYNKLNADYRLITTQSQNSLSPFFIEILEAALEKIDKRIKELKILKS